jgi:hypothetical protein
MSHAHIGQLFVVLGFFSSTTLGARQATSSYLSRAIFVGREIFRARRAECKYVEAPGVEWENVLHVSRL